MAFLIVTENEGLAPRIRSVLGLPEHSLAPRLMIVDIPDNGGYYKGPEGDVTAATVQKFVHDYMAKSLTREQMA